jgi:hypothetical protein
MAMNPAIRISSLAAGLIAAGGRLRAADAGRQDLPDDLRQALDAISHANGSAH